MIANSLKLTVLTFCIFFTTGCALTKDYVALQYNPNSSLTPVPGAEKAHVTVTTQDSRTIRDRVSSKKNGYGMEMAPIIATNDVPALFQQAFEMELDRIGFKKGPGATLVCDITRYYNDFKVGFWAGDAAADAMVNLQVKNASGQVVFAKSYAAEGRKENIQLAGGNNAKVALEAALADIVRKALSDPDLITALIEVGGSATVTLRE